MSVLPVGCCDICGIPVDAQYFDRSGFARIAEEGEDGKSSPLLKPGEQVVLASFQMHPQYCGVLQCFAQFTDAFAGDNAQVATPGLRWTLLRNGQPVAPYEQLESIINPWGYGNYSFNIRLDEGSRIELAIQNRSWAPTEIDCGWIGTVGGRIMGRYWYNAAYGGERLDGNSFRRNHASME